MITCALSYLTTERIGCPPLVVSIISIIFIHLCGPWLPPQVFPLGPILDASGEMSAEVGCGFKRFPVGVGGGKGKVGLFLCQWADVR